MPAAIAPILAAAIGTSVVVAELIISVVFIASPSALNDINQDNNTEPLPNRLQTVETKCEHTKREARAAYNASLQARLLRTQPKPSGMEAVLAGFAKADEMPA